MDSLGIARNRRRLVAKQVSYALSCDALQHRLYRHRRFESERFRHDRLERRARQPIALLRQTLGLDPKWRRIEQSERDVIESGWVAPLQFEFERTDRFRSVATG